MLPRDWLKRIRQVEIRTRRLSQQLLHGNYGSIFQGRGMDFEDVRPYAAGDDVRRIDWNVTARMQTPYVKRFVEERELTFMILVDLSASGTFSTARDTKVERAAELAGVLAFSAIRSNDRVGMLLFSDVIERVLPPAKGEYHVMNMLKEVLYHQPRSRGTSVSGALHYLNRMLLKPAVVFIISDFLDEGFENVLRQTKLRHDLRALHLYDPRDLVLPKVGWITLRDAETGEAYDVNTSRRSVRRTFAAEAARRQEALRVLFRRSGIEVLELPTDEPYISRLHHFLVNPVHRQVA
ncbi:MAG: DUF58 domain-containing protein [Opitutales bacterium]